MADYDVELLISAVRDRPTLWDKSLEAYKNRNEIAQNWMEVCMILNADFTTLSVPKRLKYEKDVIKKWKTVRSGYRKALDRIKKAKRSGAPASKIKKYIFNDQMSFMENIFDSRVSEDTSGSDECSQESAEVGTEDQQLRGGGEEGSDTLKSNSLESQSFKKMKRPNETPIGMPSEFVAQRMQITENPNRHIAFMQGLLPTLESFTDDEVLEFQAGTLSLIQSIKRARRSRP